MDVFSEEELAGWENASNGLSWEHAAIKRLVKAVRDARSQKPVITKVEKIDKPKGDIKKISPDHSSKSTGS